MSENFDLQYLTLDGGTQPRAEIDAALVEEYAAAWREGAEFPPVVAVYDGTHYWLADGFHRVHGAKAAGLEQIPAEIRQGSRRDAVLYAVGANAAHGLRRTNADKRRAVETLLRDAKWQGWSDRKIARKCAVDHKTVGRWRDELTGEIPQSDERKGADGRTINTANIGKRRSDENDDADAGDGGDETPPPAEDPPKNGGDSGDAPDDDPPPAQDPPKQSKKRGSYGDRLRNTPEGLAAFLFSNIRVHHRTFPEVVLEDVEEALRLVNGLIRRYFEDPSQYGGV